MRLAQTILHDVTVRLDSVTASLAWPVERVTVACYSTLTSQGMAVIVSTRNLFNWGYRTAIVWLLSYSVIHGYNTSGKSKNKNLGQRKVRVLLRGTLKKLFRGGGDWWEKGHVSKFWGVKRVDVDNKSLVKGKHNLHAEVGYLWNKKQATYNFPTMNPSLKTNSLRRWRWYIRFRVFYHTFKVPEVDGGGMGVLKISPLGKRSLKNILLQDSFTSVPLSSLVSNILNFWSKLWKI